jgi:hypothetical protein
VLGALQDGFEVFFVSDCSAGKSREAHEDAKTRMTMAGARPIDWVALTGEWVPDYTAPERLALVDVYSKRGGAAAMWSDWIIAQVNSGVVPEPAFLSSGSGRPLVALSSAASHS